MTELQEPITLTTPLCGLGEDYEESRLWNSTDRSIKRYIRMPGYGLTFISREAVIRHGGADPVSFDIPTVNGLAKQNGWFGVAVLDESGQIVESWPV